MVNGGLPSQSKESGPIAPQQVPVQRRKLLKAPTLAELGSSDSEVRPAEVNLPCASVLASPLPSFQSVKLGLKFISLAENETVNDFVI